MHLYSREYFGIGMSVRLSQTPQTRVLCALWLIKWTFQVPLFFFLCWKPYFVLEYDGYRRPQSSFCTMFDSRGSDIDLNESISEVVNSGHCEDEEDLYGDQTNSYYGSTSVTVPSSVHPSYFKVIPENVDEGRAFLKVSFSYPQALIARNHGLSSNLDLKAIGRFQWPREIGYHSMKLFIAPLANH